MSGGDKEKFRMALTRVPTELLDDIVSYTLPESFESMALTCKKIHDRCAPFIEQHNKLRARFRDFKYYVEPRDSLVAASDLITLIATEPIVAGYIRIANFEYDSKFLTHALARGQRPKSVPSSNCGGPIVELFARSVSLRRAGLDWKEYYATFEEDVRETRYSQHGTAFLLTLLPNTEELVIPKSWKLNAATSKLLDALVKEGKQSTHLFPSPGLASVTRVQGSKSVSDRDRMDLSWVSPFLALPHIASFRGPSCVASSGYPMSLAFQGLYTAETLRATHLSSCCIDDVGIANFLKHTPNLKTLTYSHCTKIDYPMQDWDMCKFVNAVSREAGSYLVELSIAIGDLHGPIVPGKASLRGFQKLEKLEYPLELVMCNINASGTAGHVSTSINRFLHGSTDPFVRDLIPSSVAQLSLEARGATSHGKALNVLFRRIGALRRAQLPALQEIEIGCPTSADSAYKQQCNNIVSEARGEHVAVHLNPFSCSQRLL